MMVAKNNRRSVSVLHFRSGKRKNIMKSATIAHINIATSSQYKKGLENMYLSGSTFISVFAIILAKKDENKKLTCQLKWVDHTEIVQIQIQNEWKFHFYHIS